MPKPREKKPRMSQVLDKCPQEYRGSRSVTTVTNKNYENESLSLLCGQQKLYQRFFFPAKVYPSDQNSAWIWGLIYWEAKELIKAPSKHRYSRDISFVGKGPSSIPWQWCAWVIITSRHAKMNRPLGKYLFVNCKPTVRHPLTSFCSA